MIVERPRDNRFHPQEPRPKAMITVLHPEDVTTWLRAPAEEAVTLQRPYLADRMKVRGAVFPTRKAAGAIPPRSNT